MIRNNKGQFIKGIPSLRKGIKLSEEIKKKMSLHHNPKSTTKGMKWKLSKEIKEKMRQSKLGKIPKCSGWNKGIRGYSTKWKGGKHSKQTKEKMSKARIGKSSWNKGIKMSEEYCKKLSNSLKGKNIQEKHWNWQGGITKLSQIIRMSFKYRQWKSDVFTRDNFTCQECGQRGGKLEAHHIKSFSSILKDNNITTLEEALLCEELWNLNNGITLCEQCHLKKRKNR